jgi:hypothetical protein
MCVSPQESFYVDLSDSESSHSALEFLQYVFGRSDHLSGVSEKEVVVFDAKKALRFLIGANGENLCVCVCVCKSVYVYTVHLLNLHTYVHTNMVSSG